MSPTPKINGCHEGENRWLPLWKFSPDEPDLVGNILDFKQMESMDVGIGTDEEWLELIEGLDLDADPWDSDLDASTDEGECEDMSEVNEKLKGTSNPEISCNNPYDEPEIPCISIVDMAKIMDYTEAEDERNEDTVPPSPSLPGTSTRIDNIGAKTSVGNEDDIQISDEAATPQTRLANDKDEVEMLGIFIREYKLDPNVKRRKSQLIELDSPKSSRSILKLTDFKSEEEMQVNTTNPEVVTLDEQRLSKKSDLLPTSVDILTAEALLSLRNFVRPQQETIFNVLSSALVPENPPVRTLPNVISQPPTVNPFRLGGNTINRNQQSAGPRANVIWRGTSMSGGKEALQQTPPYVLAKWGTVNKRGDQPTKKKVVAARSWAVPKEASSPTSLENSSVRSPPPSLIPLVEQVPNSATRTLGTSSQKGNLNRPRGLSGLAGQLPNPHKKSSLLSNSQSIESITLTELLNYRCADDEQQTETKIAEIYAKFQEDWKTLFMGEIWSLCKDCGQIYHVDRDTYLTGETRCRHFRATRILDVDTVASGVRKCNNCHQIFIKDSNLVIGSNQPPHSQVCCFPNPQEFHVVQFEDIHQCGICFKFYDSLTELKNHLQENHPGPFNCMTFDGRFRCIKCLEDFHFDSYKLAKHANNCYKPEWIIGPSNLAINSLKDDLRYCVCNKPHSKVAIAVKCLNSHHISSCMFCLFKTTTFTKLRTHWEIHHRSTKMGEHGKILCRFCGWNTNNNLNALLEHVAKKHYTK